MIATIKFTKKEGYGFAVPTDLIPTDGMDVYIHASRFLDEEEFKQLHDGDKILIRRIQPTGKGYDGYEISRLST